MPMSRYEIRNEYSLADPELYRAADKDDPEALLEGVAMAGLVGVLRQIGDLAEFAAEIFHDLHEEVMATAARGHGLMIRVQQLEAEVPSIEKAFLSQTDHSSFFYNAGVDWHPNLRMEQNLVTQGDLPRFVMDSYEECRGPPRLFLLDKFDVAGAGACLKRYTDPASFKVENPEITGADAQREKKIRKAKKKGPRWRNGETPEVLPTSHAKLHQLFLEEAVDNGVNNPARRVKLKRRLNGFPFDTRTGKSYMEKILKTPSPEHKMLQEITVSSPLELPTNDHNGSDLKVLEVRSVSPAADSMGRKRSPPQPYREEIMLNPSMYEMNEVPAEDKICDAPNSYLNVVTDGISSTLDEETGQKDITIDGEGKTEGSLTGYQSDDIASEIDNYVDAPSTMESELETDSELRVKKDFTSSYTKSKPLISDANDEHLHMQSSDSQSTGDSTISDEGSNPSRKEIARVLSSGSQSISAENPQSEKSSVEGFPSSDIPDIAILDAASYQKTAYEDFPVDHPPRPVVSDSTCTGKDTISNHRPNFEQLTSNFFSTDSMSICPHSDSEGDMKKDRAKGATSNEAASLEDEEMGTNLIMHSPSSPSVSDSKSQSGDDSSLTSSGKHLVNEPDGEDAPSVSTVSDILCDSTHGPAAISAYLLHEYDSNVEDINQVENITSALNMCNALSQNRNDTAEMISAEKPVPGILDDEVLKLPENFPSESTDMEHSQENITSTVSTGETLHDDLDNKESNVVSDASNHFSCINEASSGKELVDSSFSSAETIDAEDHYANSYVDNQITSETLILSLVEDTPDCPEASLDAHVRDVIPEEQTTTNEVPELGMPRSYEVVGRTGTVDDVTRNDSVALETSCCTPQNLEDSTDMSETAQKEGINQYSGATGLEITEMSSSEDVKSQDEVHVVLDEADCRTYQSESVEAEMASCVPAVSDDAIIENVNLPMGLHKLVEEHIPYFEDSGLDALENDKDSLSGSHNESCLVEEDENSISDGHKESGLVEEVGETEAVTSDLHTDFCNTINNDHPKSEVLHTVSNSYADSEVEHKFSFFGATRIQSQTGQSFVDSDKDCFQQSGVTNQVSEALSLPVDYGTEETMLLEKIELPPDRLNQELLDSGEKSSELSSLLPINHQQMLGNDDIKGDNNSAFMFSLLNCQPSASELPGVRSYDMNISGYPQDSGSILPPTNLLSVTNQINLDELPPLPPLPPVQWRMGKLQHALATTEGENVKHKELPSEEISSSTASTNDVNSPLQEINHTLIHKELPPEEISSSSASMDIVSSSLQEMNHSSKHKELPSQEISSSTPSSDEFSSSLQEMNHSLKHKELPSQEISSSTPSTDDFSSSLQEINHSLKHKELPAQEVALSTTSTDDVSSSLQEMNHSLIQIVPETTSKEVKVEHSSCILEANSIHETIDLPPRTENEQKQLVVPTLESEVTPPAEEDGVANGSRTVKLPRPRNPLVDDLAALDKSKLRKVTERVRPQIQKVDERDSLLEQIRAKSFNLKPAVTTRPSIQGPKTNLKLAAILEKANAIRQALAGSDEDDEDNWSDS
ncbi:protein SCAR2 [Sesamum alatum]|uniref:Protein SCAR n=1 Tax=Sesamum alatum TaxID=300844 RepID=A0AAE1YL45_9LAMI|nr:protein SCAR2 [Sesamum alatum]